MGVSKNSCTPKSSILIRFSIINHPFWGTTILGNPHIYYFPDRRAVFLCCQVTGRQEHFGNHLVVPGIKGGKLPWKEPKNPSKIELVDTQVFFSGSVQWVLLEMSWIKKNSSQNRMNKITEAGMNRFLKENLGHIFWVWNIQYTNVEVNIKWHPCMVYDNINLYTNIYPNTKPNVGNYLLCIQTKH